MSNWLVPTPIVTRTPPHNIEVEQGLLGAILLNNDAMGYVLVAGLEAGDFFEPIHAAFFGEIARQHALGQRVTPVTLKQSFPDIEIAGMALGQYLARLVAEATTVINATDYAALTRDLALTRRMLALTTTLGQARDDNQAPAEALRAALEEMDAVRLRMAQATDRRHTGSAQGAINSVTTRMLAIIAGELVETGIGTGLPELDRMTDGLKPGELVIIAGRPGMGKSTVAGSLARQIATPTMHPTTGEIGPTFGVGFFSMEMPELHMGARLLADASRTTKFKVDYRDIVKGIFRDQRGEPVSAEENSAIAERLANFERDHEPAAIEFDYAASNSIGEIVAKSRAMARRLAVRKIPLKVLMFDYLKFIRPAQRYAGNRNNEIGEITASLKMLARDLDVCCVLLAQLNRKVEERADKRPELQDLRDSGEIEADADAVWFLYREAYYLKKNPNYENEPELLAKFKACEFEIEIGIAKQRMGPTGAVKLYCDPSSASIRRHDAGAG